MPVRRITLITIGLFLAVSAVVYGKAVLTSEFVRWDDGMLVYENPAIRSITPATLKYIFTTYDPELYIPLTFLTYQIDYLIGGIAPFQYHFTSFLFHTLNALLVAWFATLFFKKRWLGIFCGLLFLLHPLHTEAVMWVSGRKDVLSTFFFLLTLIYWMKWKHDQVRRLLIASIGFFALALMSKIMAVTLPAVLLLLDWRDGRRWTREIFIEKIPYFALAGLFGLIGYLGKTGVVASSSIWEKILMAGKSSLFYIQKILWPDYFSLLYPYHQDVVITSSDFYIPIIVWSVLIILIVLSLRRTRDIAFGMAFYLVTIAPTFLNFTKGGDLDVYFASDRYAYVPSIGVFIAIVALAVMILKDRLFGRVPVIIAGVIVIILAYRSFLQSKVWANTYDLLTNVLIHYPESHVAHNNIANAWRLEDRLDDAIGEFQKALAIKQHPKIYANLGAVYRKQGKMSDAMDAYKKALELNPQSKDALMGRGLVWLAQKNFAAAENDFLAAIAIYPRYLEAHTNLGATYAFTGRMQEAIAEYRTAIAINSFFPDAHFNLGVALEATGDLEGAIDEYAYTVSLAPRSVAPRINLALLLYKVGDTEGAREQFKEILTIDPNNAAARSALRQIGN